MGIPKTQIGLLGTALHLEELNKTDPRWPFRPAFVLHKRALGLQKHGLLKRVRIVDGHDEFELTRKGRAMAMDLRKSNGN